MTIAFLSIIVWRITYMITQETGPLGIFERMREIKHLISPLHCFYCTSVWVAFPLAFLTDFPLFYWLILSSIAIFIQGVHERLV